MSVRPAFLLAALLFPFAAHANCPPTGATVTVAREDPEPTISVVPMRALRGQMQAAASGHVGDHLGVTASRVEWRMELATRFLRGPDGRICAVADRVSIVLAHIEHAIRMAEEIPREGCLWREVLAHEQRHVAVNRATLAQAEAALRAAVTDWSRRAYARANEAEGATAALQASLRATVEPHLAAMRRARAEGHGRIDTPAEYDRLARICPGDQRRMPPPR